MTFEGFCETHELPIKRGQTVTIKKGTMVKIRGKERPAGRTYTVKIDHILNGVSQPVIVDGGYVQIPEKAPSVRWSGTGGYWAEVCINDLPEATG